MAKFLFFPYVIFGYFCFGCVIFNPVVARNEFQYDRFDLIYINKDLLTVNANTTFFNRTRKVLNFQFTLSEELPRKSRVSAVVYLFQSNQFRLSAMRVGHYLKEGITMKFFDIQRMMEMFEPPVTWPLLPKVITRI